MIMMNMRLINKAVELVAKINEANYIYETDEAIRARVENWYNHTEITDVEGLAAMALSGDFDPAVRQHIIDAAREFYFPTMPFEYTHQIHIHEIEGALHDEIWR